MQEQNFVPWKFHPRHSDFEPSWPAESSCIKSIVLRQHQDDPEDVLRPSAPIDESYRLTVPLSGEVVIEANTSIGLSYGLTTFSQLFYKHSQSGVYMTNAPVVIEDRPTFAHRGLNLDTARNYLTVDEIKRTLDAMALTKMNRLHWHITDAQSWPLVIPVLPELAEKGAYARSLVYTPEQLAEVMDFSSVLGIETIIEVDMPGHTSSIWFSHPELIASFNSQPYDKNCAEPPCGTLKLNDSAVYNFADQLLEDLLPRVGRYSGYFHSGGDEIKEDAYLLDETIRSNDSTVIQPLLQKFVDHIHDKIRAAGLTPMVWEELLLQWNLTLGSDVVINSWQSDQGALQIVQKGHKVLLGNYDTWYLDCGQGQWINSAPETAAAFYPYNDYCSPHHNWRLIYSVNPLHNIPVDLQHLILGGEVHLWSEQMDGVNLDRQAWPRAAAAAEVLWSGAIDPVTGSNRSQIDAAPRLSEFRERLVTRGIMAEPIQMPFCTQNGSQCVI